MMEYKEIGIREAARRWVDFEPYQYMDLDGEWRELPTGGEFIRFEKYRKPVKGEHGWKNGMPEGVTYWPCEKGGDHEWETHVLGPRLDQTICKKCGRSADFSSSPRGHEKSNTEPVGDLVSNVSPSKYDWSISENALREAINELHRRLSKLENPPRDG